MAFREDVLSEVKADLGENYISSDESVLMSILTDVIEDALRMSNRANNENNLSVLKSNIKKATKSIYLLRGVEDVKSNSQSGLSNTYDNVMETMLTDIIRQNKRLMR